MRSRAAIAMRSESRSRAALRGGPVLPDIRPATATGRIEVATISSSNVKPRRFICLCSIADNCLWTRDAFDARKAGHGVKTHDSAGAVVGDQYNSHGGRGA